MGEKPVAAVPGGNDDNGGGEGMHCPDHPSRSNPGGICAFCLQERLGKLVSSSKSSTSFFPVPRSSSSSSSPSPPSSSATPLPRGSRGGGGLSSGGGPPPTASSRHRLMLFSTKNKMGGAGAKLSRSSSVAPSTFQPMDGQRRRWFRFLHHQHHNHSEKPSSVSSETKDLKNPTMPTPKRVVTVVAAAAAEEEGGNQTTPSSYGTKVSRSRSVGCGSRSFSGDFLERISTGLGDCALRRAESQREQKNMLHRASTSAAESGDRERGGDGQRVRCGGIFGGFGMSTPSSTSSASYWLPSGELAGSGSRLPQVGTRRGAGGKGRGWGWAFASPIRAFRPSSKTRDPAAGNDAAPTTPNGTVGVGVVPVGRKSPAAGSGGRERSLSTMVVATG